MKAALLTKFGEPFEVVDDVEIDDPGPGELLVKVSHCGVCHSDYSVWEGHAPGYVPPVILGHEAAGVISAVGPDANGRSIGEHVILSMRGPCGHCYQCVRGNYIMCEKPQAAGRLGPRVRWRGHQVMRGFGLGGFAEYVLVESRQAVSIAPDEPLDIAAVVGCAVQTGVGAVRNMARVLRGDSVLVIGAGSVGACVVQGSMQAGAGAIIVVDPNARRRQQALELGATHAFDTADPDVLGQVRSLTNGRGADHAFDLVSINATISLAIAATRPAANVVLIGVPGPSESATLQPMSFVMAQKQLTGCMLGNCNAPEDLPEFMRMHARGELAIDRLITARRPLAEINTAFADLAGGRGLRTVLSI